MTSISFSTPAAITAILSSVCGADAEAGLQRQGEPALAGHRMRNALVDELVGQHETAGDDADPDHLLGQEGGEDDIAAQHRQRQDEADEPADEADRTQARALDRDIGAEAGLLLDLLIVPQPVEPHDQRQRENDDEDAAQDDRDRKAGGDRRQPGLEHLADREHQRQRGAQPDHGRSGRIHHADEAPLRLARREQRIEQRLDEGHDGEPGHDRGHHGLDAQRQQPGGVQRRIDQPARQRRRRRARHDMGERDVEGVQAVGVLRAAEARLEAGQIAAAHIVEQHRAEEGDRHQAAADARHRIRHPREPAPEDVARRPQVLRHGRQRVRPHVGAQHRRPRREQRLGEERAAAVADRGLQLLRLQEGGTRDLQGFVGIREGLQPCLALAQHLRTLRRRTGFRLGPELVEPDLGLLDTRRLLVDQLAQLVQRRLQAHALALQLVFGGRRRRQQGLDLRQLEADGVEARTRRGRVGGRLLGEALPQPQQDQHQHGQGGEEAGPCARRRVGRWGDSRSHAGKASLRSVIRRWLDRRHSFIDKASAVRRIGKQTQTCRDPGGGQRRGAGGRPLLFMPNRTSSRRGRGRPRPVAVAGGAKPGANRQHRSSPAPGIPLQPAEQTRDAGRGSGRAWKRLAHGLPAPPAALSSRSPVDPARRSPLHGPSCRKTPSSGARRTRDPRAGGMTEWMC
jgi:hypothetical protein